MFVSHFSATAQRVRHEAIWVCTDLDVNKVSNEGHEDHLVSIPALPGVYFNPPLQLPPLATVTHEDLKEGAKKKI